MNKRSILSTVFVWTILSAVLPADTLKLPKEQPAITATIPPLWKSEDKGAGVECTSPDRVATMFMEVSTEQNMKNTIESSLKWLAADQKVMIDAKTRDTKEFDAEGLKWKRMAWEGASEEKGSLEVGLAFANVGHDRVLTITYWINRNDHEKQMEAISDIMDSIKILPH